MSDLFGNMSVGKRKSRVDDDDIDMRQSVGTSVKTKQSKLSQFMESRAAQQKLVWKRQFDSEARALKTKYMNSSRRLIESKETYKGLKNILSVMVRLEHSTDTLRMVSQESKEMKAFLADCSDMVSNSADMDLITKTRAVESADNLGLCVDLIASICEYAQSNDLKRAITILNTMKLDADTVMKKEGANNQELKNQLSQFEDEDEDEPLQMDF